VKIHKEYAYMATSWGLGQVIGANFRNEFNSIEEMEKELMTGNSSSQLFLMATFIFIPLKVPNYWWIAFYN
jgi:hypothetical protein